MMIGERDLRDVAEDRYQERIRYRARSRQIWFESMAARKPDFIRRNLDHEPSAIAFSISSFLRVALLDEG